MFSLESSAIRAAFHLSWESNEVPHVGVPVQKTVKPSSHRERRDWFSSSYICLVSSYN